MDSDTVANLEEAWKLVQYMYKFFQEVFEVSRATIEVPDCAAVFMLPV